MKICVFGLGHLGCVTAACLADKGFEIVGLDPSESIVNNLNKGIPPIFEPGLEELINKNLNKNLRFTTNMYSATKNADIIWITFDTPVDDKKADEIYVKRQIMWLFSYLQDRMTVLISSQLTVGTTNYLREEYRKWFKNSVEFAYSPENLRHGKAIEIFNDPIRIVVGSENESNIPLKILLRTICKNVMWMSSESAEMTKHALNSFLATEIAFINEIATICKETGANIRDVEMGLKSDPRIGYRGFLNSGEAYSGGTLSRDVQYLKKISDDLNLKSTLIRSINESNNNHKKLLER